MTENRKQVVIMTGASGRLGAVVSRTLHDAGWTVVGISRDATQQPAEGLHLTADLADPDSLQSAVARAAELGPVRALVHLVGGFSMDPLEQTSVGVWERMLALNATSAFRALQAVLPHLKANGGSIVAVGARPALEPQPCMTAYSASKAALVALMRAAACEVKHFGVTVNVVAPGTLDMPPASETMDRNLLVQTSSVANAIAWLVSREAAQVTGAVVPVYGGGL